MSYYAVVTEDSLQHHGVKNQSWGVRNAEWYPIEEYKKHLSRVDKLESKRDKKTSKLSTVDKKAAKYKKRASNNRFERKSARYKIKSVKLRDSDPVKSAKLQTKSDKYAIKSKRLNQEEKTGLKKYFDKKADRYQIKSDRLKEQIAKLSEKIDIEKLSIEETDPKVVEAANKMIEKMSSSDFDSDRGSKQSVDDYYKERESDATPGFKKYVEKRYGSFSKVEDPELLDSLAVEYAELSNYEEEPYKHIRWW